MAPHSSLLVCPKNLKECIDWVLRATERDKTGTNNDIVNLNKALEAELKGFINNSDDLTQLVQGLCLFMGYPSCVCKPKKSVEESLEKISGELKEELKNYECKFISIPKLDLNCPSCVSSSNVVCKCCVLDCIREVLKCKCVKGSNNNCQCSINVEPKRCCKDLLEKLKACLSLLNLRADMENLCSCPENCCDNGECTQKDSSKCSVCPNSKTLKTPKDYTVTGLGLLRPSPKRLAEKLNDFFGSTGQGPKGSCSCQCGSGPSCCCLACTDKKCSESCNSECLNGSSHQSQGCPRKTFCQNINSIKVPSDAGDMTCCESGTKCHCELGSTSGSNCQSGQCCVVTSGSNKYHSLKCLIRRLVKFFKDLSLDSSQSGCSKLCCELLCVLKISYFLKDLYNDSKKWAGKDSCGKCSNGKGTGKCTQGTKQGSCCNGKPSACKSGNCCQGCPECNAIKFRKALQTLRFAGPCGQDLYRVLDSFLHYCCNVFRPYVDSIQGNVKSARDSCSNCGKPGQRGKPAKACECSKSGSCKGCQEILKDFQLKVTLAGGYSSSYSSSASWKSLCSSKPCCQPSCLKCPSSGSSQCPPQGCCEKCPKRLCAKIFLGMLPCLYYGLKILYERCKYGSGFAGWHDISMDSDGKPSSDLAKFFYAWGYDVRPLISKKGSEFSCILENLFGSSGKFKSLFDFVSEKYFVPSGSLSPSDSKPPKTVREMLLWLYGLRFHKHFSDLVSHCKDLCLPFGNSFHPDAFCYYIHTCCFLAPISIISFIEASESAQKVFTSAEWKSFCYPENPSELFEKFCDLVRKIYIPLHFLKFQCERVPGQGGWRDCYFGLNCKVEPLASTSSSGPSSGCSSCPNSGSYLCTASGQNKDVHKEHCDPNGGGGKGCINANGSGKCSDPGHGSKCPTPCPHPLMRFLCDSDSQSPSSPFRLPFSFARIDFSKTPPVILEASSDKFLTMGFSPDKLSSTAKSGYSLGHRVLHVFCREDGFYPLTRLLQFSLCVSRYPETLGELFAFFFRFSESDVFKNYFESYVDGEPGWYRGKALQDALEQLYGSEDSHKNSSHPSDLRSLIACSSQTGSTCGKYLHPLTYNAYDKNIFIKDFLGTYLSWVCYSAEKFKEKLEKFKKDFEDSCSSCSSGSSCTKIVECPCALPFLYSFGFSFWSPGDLNCVDNEGNSKHTVKGGKDHEKEPQKCTMKTCSQFLAQLEKVVKGDPFNALLRIIDEFIWHIRLPFIYAFLYIWILVISYFYYVQFYKLDLLHIDSHLHLPRSFKLLPSTFFSDASSKLKDLSYFTL